MTRMHYRGSPNIIASRLRQRRRAERITQIQLAARMQVLEIPLDQHSISQIETGKRIVTDFEVRGLAQALHVSADWLLGNQD